MRNTAFQQANLMADQLNANMDRIKTEILESGNALGTPVPAPAHSSVVLESVTNPSVNATTDHFKSDAVINEQKAQVESLQTATPSPHQDVLELPLGLGAILPITVGPMALVLMKELTARTNVQDIRMRPLSPTRWGAVPIIANPLVPDGVGWSRN